MKKDYLTNKDGEVRELKEKDMELFHPIEQIDKDTGALMKELSAKQNSYNKPQTPIHVHLDSDILAWIKNEDSDFGSHINALLRKVMESDTRKTP